MPHMLDVTTQFNKQDADYLLSHKFSTNNRMMQYRRINSTFFNETFFVTEIEKSVRGYTCMQLFVSKKGFVKVYGMKSVKEFPQAQRRFVKEAGAPKDFVVNPHWEQTSKETQYFCHKIRKTLGVLEE